MAKRFTDSEKWKKGFVKSLKAPYKLLWLYITDECDFAGIWHVELDVAASRIGLKLDEEEAIKVFGDKIIIFDNGEKWFIPDFISFQYGSLQENNRVHFSIIQRLKKYNLINTDLTLKPLAIPLISPLQGAKDKDMDKDIETFRKESEKTLLVNTNQHKDVKSKYDIPYAEIINYLNLQANKHYRQSGEGTRKLIRARWTEGFVVDDFKKVIDHKCMEWKDDQKMDKFLRPETLFGTKFENYLNSPPKPRKLISKVAEKTMESGKIFLEEMEKQHA